MFSAQRPQVAPVTSKVPTFVTYYYWITTHFADPGEIEGWVGHVGWLIADTSPRK